MKEREGYPFSKLQNAICRTVMSNQASAIMHLFVVNTPKKGAKRLMKSLNASENWQVIDGVIYSDCGVSFHGLASWGITLSVRMGTIDYRFKIFHLDRFWQRSVYAIPIQLLDNVTELPKVALSKEEIRLLFEMANEVRSSKSDQEHLICLTKPALNTITPQITLWKEFRFESEHLLELLEEFPILLDTAVVALDAQVRSFKQLRKAPMGIYNFLLPPGDAEAGKWLLTALSALTFSNESGAISSGPIEIQLKESQDLKRWELCFDRLSVIRTATGSLLWPLVKCLEDQQRIQKSGGYVTRPFPTTPITLCKSILHCPQAIDIVLPEEACPLTDEQQDLLRHAMSLLLNHDTAKKVYQQWKNTMVHPTAYRLSGFATWRSILAEQILRVWFPTEYLYSRGSSLYVSSKKQHEEEVAERNEIFRHAFAFLSNLKNYGDRIIERPTSKIVARARLSKDAVAFRFVPQKGEDAGKKFLAFTKESLLRLLSQVNFREEMYIKFLMLCTENGILDQTNRSIKFTDGTFSAVTFQLSD